jgi:hypothetical protein
MEQRYAQLTDLIIGDGPSGQRPARLSAYDRRPRRPRHHQRGNGELMALAVLLRVAVQ